MKTILFPLIILIIVSSCGNKDTATELIDINGNDFYLTHADQISDTIDLLLSDLIDDCEAIVLNAGPDSYISAAYKVAVSENYIAIKDSEKIPVKLFSRDGTYLREIGAMGRGPNEYNISLYGIQIDEAREQLYLLPFANARRIMVFGLDGEPRTHIPLRFQQRKFKAHIADDIVTVLGMPFKNDSAVVFQQTLEGELIHFIPSQDYHLAQEFSSEVQAPNNTGNNDFFQLIWSKTPNDTLYYYDTRNNKLIPRFTLAFEGEEWPVYICNELPRHLTGWIYGRGNFVVEKNTLETSYYRLINDFYGGIELNFHWDSARGLFLSSIPALKLKKEIQRCLELKQTDKIRARLEELNSRINEESNDILFVGHYAE